MSRARSHRYPDRNSDYVDTTYYDSDSKYLDIGFQKLKIFNFKSYPKLSDVRTLFIDHNCLTNLPDPKYIPHLTSLNCSHNNLELIPFYPELHDLTVCNNKIKNLELYNGSKLEYLDCSFNTDLKFLIHLPNLHSLYITDCNLKILYLELIPQIRILDCENNFMEEIVSTTDSGSNSNLTELNLYNNNISVLSGAYPKLVRLNVDYNKLSQIETYPKLEFLSSTHNKIQSIKSQPSLIKLYSRNNLLTHIGSMPNLKIIDVAHNQLNQLNLYNSNSNSTANLAHMHMHFNPIKKLSLEFSKLKELQIDFATYKNIHGTYDKEFTTMEIHCGMEKLNSLLVQIGPKIFNSEMVNYIKKKMSRIMFDERDVHVYKLSLILYWKLFHRDNVTSIEELTKTDKFIFLLKTIGNMYYNTIIITLYFNGYHPE